MHRSALLILITLIAISESHAEDSCNYKDIFIRDLGSKVSIANNSDSALAIKHAECQKSSNSSSSAISVHTGGSYTPIINGYLNGSHGSNSDNSSSNCGSGEQQQHFDAAMYYAQSVYHDVVDAWKNCMLIRQEFACWVANHGDKEHLTIHARWGILSAQPIVDFASVRVGNRAPQSLLPPGAKLHLDENIFDVDRHANEVVIVDILATPDGASAKTSSVTVPAVEEIQATDAATISATFQNLAPLSSVPPPAQQCACVSEFLPPAPDGNHPPHDPFPPGTNSKIINNCESDVSVFIQRETIPASMMVLGLNAAPGRTFSNQTLKPKQLLVADIGGAVAVGTFINSCPASATQISSTSIGLPPLPPIACVSNKATHTDRARQPLACQGVGPPGSPCSCNEGDIVHPGIIWVGELPPLPSPP